VRHYPLNEPSWLPDSVVFSTINDHGGYSEPVRVPVAGGA
jgi:hypothetical protein